MSLATIGDMQNPRSPLSFLAIGLLFATTGACSTISSGTTISLEQPAGTLELVIRQHIEDAGWEIVVDEVGYLEAISASSTSPVRRYWRLAVEQGQLTTLLEFQRQTSDGTWKPFGLPDRVTERRLESGLIMEMRKRLAKSTAFIPGLRTWVDDSGTERLTQTTRRSYSAR